MDEDLNLELDNIQGNVENNLKVKNRFEKLSETAILASKGREEAEALTKVEAEARLNAEKERDFYKDFSTHSAKYPGASEYQTQIWEKRKAGYEVEDAMVAVLAKEGKLNLSSSPVQQPDIVGGSSPTLIPGDKPYNSMSATEKLSVLEEIEKSTGGLSQLLRGNR